MELTKRITISEVEEKIKELRVIDDLLNNKLKVVRISKYDGLADINKTLNDEIIALAINHLNNKRKNIIEELQENGIVEHSIEHLKK